LSGFYDSILRGNTAKELVKVLLQKSGYEIYPYGYESTLSDIRTKLSDSKTRNSRTVRRIRSSPDLLVYDDERKDLMLVEIKMRSTSNYLTYESLRIDRYREFWNDSILVVVVPFSDVFYAQRISEFECRSELSSSFTHEYNVKTEFEKLEEIFTRVSKDDITIIKRKLLSCLRKDERLSSSRAS